MSKERCSTAGFSLIELILVLSLLSIVIYKASTVMSTMNEVAREEATSLKLESHAQTVLDRIALAIIGAEREELAPILTPGHSTGLRYQASLGVENGTVVWSDPEEISIAALGDSQVRWRQNPDQVGERSVVWTNMVLPLLEGELPNGVDDNGNGLVDEEGLNFVVEGNSVTIRLSLGDTTLEGERLTRTLETTVTCRNRPLE